MTFLRNIWADLVEKRLWPVALALLVGIVAVPVMLAKGSEDTVANDPTAPGAIATNAAVAKADKAIALNTAVAATARRNRSGTPRNPFKQLFVVKDKATTTTTGGDTTSTGGSSTPTSGGTNTNTGGTTTPKPKTTTTDVYRVNLRFGQAGGMHTIKDIARLTPLPSATNPFFVFLGVKNDGHTAVFLVSSDAKATGDGTCKPSSSDCETIEMGAGDTEFFDLTTDSGVQQYQMDVISIAHTTVTRAAAKASHARSSQIGAGMLQEARKAGDLPQQLGWYRWDAAAGVLVPSTGDALDG